MAQDKDNTRPVSRGEQKRVMELATLLPGALFAERYEIVEAIGAGGSAEVYRARDTLAGGEVALKVLYPGPGQSSLGRLQREMRLVRKLHHSGILRVHDLGKSEGLLYTVSEMLEGETLRDRLVREGRLDAPEAERILRGVLEPLALAHEHGVVHRDIKPGNVFLARGAEGKERVVLLDFGLARETQGEGLTATGALLGTPEYCSPEQAEGARDLTPASDVYSCGITFWQMLAGLPPFRGDSEVKILAAHLQQPLPRVTREIPGLPLRLRALLYWMLEKDAEKRIADAGSALDALSERGVSSTLRARLRVARGRRAARGRGRAALLAAVGLVILALALGWLLTPRSVSVQEKLVSWELGLGMTWSKEYVAGGLRHAFLDEKGLGPFRRTWLLAWERRINRSENRVLSLATPWHAYREEYTGAEADFAAAPSYPGQRGSYVIRGFLRWYMDGSPCSALSWERGAGYTGAISIRCPENQIENQASVLHPGRFRDMRVVRHGARDFTVVASGSNNWLGPRNVLVGVRTPSKWSGQLPPYMLNPARVGESNAWYLPLGAFRALNMTIEVEGELVRVNQGHGEETLVRARDGVPLRASERDGLSEEDFLQARRAARRALFEALGLAWSSREQEAALRLEEAAGRLPASSRWRPLLLYRAALLWQTHAWKADLPGSLELALEAIRGARELERDAPRFPLLEAELLARLGRGEEAIEVSDAGWGHDREPNMYVWDWILVRKLAGQSTLPRRLANFIADNKRLPAWGAALDIILAFERGDHAEVSRLFEARLERGSLWALFGYWAARSRVETGDLAGALESLDQSTEMDASSDPEPVENLRARIIAQLDPGQLSDEILESAHEELAFLEKDAATNIQSLYHLKFARKDAAIVAERLGDEVRAAELRALARQTFAAMTAPATTPTPPP